MNKTNQSILDFLEYYCGHKGALQYAVLVNGAWGSGKTHLVRKFLEDHKDIRTLYVSLYGMKDTTEIEDAFFAQLHPVLASKTMKIAGTLLKGALRGALKVELGQFDKIKAEVSGEPFSVAVPAFLKDAAGRVIIFDDLERSEIPLRKLMGFINGLVEHDETKVILIANEAEVSKGEREGYIRTKEKLVGKTFEIEVDFGTAVGEFIKLVEDADARQFLTVKRQRLETIFRQSGTNNLRILQQGLWDFERLIEKMEPSQKKNVEAMEAIFGPFISLFFELRAGRVEADDLKGLDQINWIKLLGKKKDGAAKSKTEEVKDRYPEIQFDQSIIGIDLLIDALFRSVLDGDLIKGRVAQSPFFARPADITSWKVLWNHNSYSDEDCKLAFVDVDAKFKARGYVVPGVILQVFGLRLWLTEIGQLKQSKADTVVECQNYVEDLYAAGRLPPSEPNDRGLHFDNTAFDGLGYHQVETPEFKGLVQFLNGKRKAALADTYPRAIDALTERMVTNPDEFFGMLTSGNQGTGDFAFVPVLADLDPAIFVSRLLKMEKTKLRTALIVFKPRYELIAHYRELEPELAWLRKVEQLLLAEAKKREPIARNDLENAVKWYLSDPLGKAEAVFPKKVEEPKKVVLINPPPKKKT